MKKKQSSVDWIFEQVCNLDWKNLQLEKKLEIFEQARSMHREEIDDAYWFGYGDHQTLDMHDLNEIFEYIFKVRNEK